jgi:hypothetical protein
MPNKDFSQAARGQWFGLRETGKDISKLLSYLALGKTALTGQIEPLQAAVEEGVVEYKRGAAAAVFGSLKKSRFRSLEARELKDTEKICSCLIFAIWVQKLIAEGKVLIRERKAVPVDAADEPETGDILEEIEARVTADPSAAGHPAVKNILLQKQKYEKEMETLKKLTRSAPKEKTREIAANFHRSFADIFASIKKNYLALLREEEEARRPQSTDPLLRFDLRPLAAVYSRQAEAASQLRAAVVYSRGGGSGPREVLVAASEQETAFRDLLKEEMQHYMNMTGDRKIALDMSASFVRELVRMINLWKDDLY